MSITSTIFVLLVGVLFVYVVIATIVEFAEQDYETEVSVLVSGTDSVSFDAVYIRDEAPLFASYSGVLSYYAADGEKVLAGNTVAEIYGSESDIDTISRINSLRSEIQLLRKIENPDMTIVANPSSVSEQIGEMCTLHLDSISKGEYSSIENTRENLLFLMCSYDKITGKLSGVTERANELEEELTRLNQTKSSPVSTIAADTKGYFVSTTDGYEGQFGSDKLVSLTKEQIQSVINENKESATETAATAGAIGKIISNPNWYVAGIFDNSLGKYTVSTKVKLKTSQSGVTVDAVISEIRKTDNPKEDIVILTSEYIYPPALRLRTEKIEMVRNEYEGVKIPRSAIHFKYLDEISLDENNEPIQTGFDKDGKKVYKTEPVEYRGVYVKQGDAVLFKKIRSIYEGDDYVVSMLPSEMLAEVPEGSGGDLDFSIREIKTKEINGWGVDQLQKMYVSLYDEMVIKGFELSN
jgi:hypothetical protein